MNRRRKFRAFIHRYPWAFQASFLLVWALKLLETTQKIPPQIPTIGEFWQVWQDSRGNHLNEKTSKFQHFLYREERKKLDVLVGLSFIPAGRLSSAKVCLQNAGVPDFI